jgi:WD40 repeat protein
MALVEPVTRAVECTFAPVDEGSRASFSGDGALLATSTAAVVLWNTSTGKRLGTFDEFQTAAPVRSGEISPSGKFIYWTSRGSGAFQEISSRVVGPRYGANAVISPDDRTIVTFPDTNWAMETTPPALHRASNGKTVYELPHAVTAVSFCASGEMIATITSRDVVLRSVTDREVSVPVEVEAQGWSLARFSPDGTRLATLAPRGTLRIHRLLRCDRSGTCHDPIACARVGP